MKGREEKRKRKRKKRERRAIFSPETVRIRIISLHLPIEKPDAEKFFVSVKA
jgi:hypothetical protein